MLHHSVGVMLHPNTTWQTIRQEKTSFKQVFLSHVPFLALVPTVSAFYGVTQVGWRVGDGSAVHLSVDSALTLCVLTYVALLVGVFVLGEFINWMASTYGVSGDRDVRHHAGTALAVCVTTPIFLSGIFLLYPVVWLNASAMIAAGAYSVYLIYNGIPVIMNIDRDRAFLYASSVITVGLVLMVTAIIATVIIWGMGIGPEYVD